MTYEKSAGAIVFKTENGILKFLLLKAPSVSVKNPHSIWLFPKGNVSENETLQDCALREVKEETGLTQIKPVWDFKITEKYMYKKDGNLISKTVYYFLFELTADEEVKISKEHISYSWVSLEDANKLLKIKAARENLAKAYEFISARSHQQKLL